MSDAVTGGDGVIALTSAPVLAKADGIARIADGLENMRAATLIASALSVLPDSSLYAQAHDLSYSAGNRVEYLYHAIQNLQAAMHMAVANIVAVDQDAAAAVSGVNSTAPSTGSTVASGGN